ncbi:hypothetical protein CK203_108931 [Vitis vinifera]|uniref:Uncharacterized protein n=1 Tax=Vitis vinifera TaxID=29760 RepID=A0A438CH21_VITVI|nr:hypothetical protein CK203_108931 [Vitis vinifera]
MYTGEWWSPAQLIMDTIFYFFQEGEGETVRFSSKLSHSFASVALILLDPSAPELAVPISTLAVLISDLPRPSQPQVVDATPSTLSIMACLDTLQELFVSMDSHIDARLRLTPPMVQGASEVVTPIVEITDQATTPMLEDIAQVATPVLEEIDGVVDPIIGA